MHVFPHMPPWCLHDTRFFMFALETPLNLMAMLILTSLLSSLKAQLIFLPMSKSFKAQFES